MFHEIAPKKLDITYENKEPKESDLVIYVTDGKILRKEGEELSLPTIKELGLGNEEVRFLFKIDETSFFMPLGKEEKEAGTDLTNDLAGKVGENGWIFETPRDMRNAKPMWIAYAATLGFRIEEFYRLNSFCGKCGTKNRHSHKERAMVCPECGNTVYPPIAPSVIVLIRNGEETVLTKYQVSHSAYRRYALVAGYVESGETPEETVKREVFEEVGLKVKNISYYKSQPWPISGALLLGYVCDLDGDNTITRQEDELAVAEWVKRSDVPERSSDVSLTSEMMEMFRTGRL